VACTLERYAPALDVIATASNLVGFVDAVSTGADPAVDVLTLVAAGAYLGSAVYGYVTTSRCADAKDDAYRFHAKQLTEQVWLLGELVDAQAHAKPADAKPTDERPADGEPSDNPVWSVPNPQPNPGPDPDHPVTPSAPPGGPTHPPN